MSDHILKTIEELESKLATEVAAVESTKQFINQLCKLADLPPRYDAPSHDTHSGVRLSIRSDQFYGQPLASCVREILAMRKGHNQGPATINEIYTALQDGGFAFETKNDDNAKRGLRISITKNTAMFHKLPTGRIGLLEWYPNAKVSKVRRPGAVSSDGRPASADERGDDEASELDDDDGGEP